MKLVHPTVLVADDDLRCRDSVQEALERVGYRTVAAETGREAVEVARAGAAHVGIFDVHMPELSGVDALEMLRLERIEIPVIVMTSDRSEELHERIRLAGAVDLVPKPIDLVAIRGAVRHVIERYC